MTEFITRLKVTSVDCVSFFCPGCNTSHSVKVSGGGAWAWNECFDTPTFSQSVLSTGGHYLEGHHPGDECWCTYNTQHPEEGNPFTCHRCHSYIEHGSIRFLSDCSHDLVNQTVPLPAYPRDE